MTPCWNNSGKTTYTKMKDGLYHKDMYLPKINKIDKDFKVEYTIHAIKAAYNDRYDEIVLPDTINLAKSDIIEIEVESGEIIKILIRTRYNSKYDLNLAIVPQTLKVKTVWLNEKNDDHKTLRKEVYNQQ